MDTLMGILVFVLQFSAGIGALLAVPALVYRIAKWISHYRGVRQWQADMAVAGTLGLLAVVAFILLPAGERFMLVGMLTAGALLEAFLACASLPVRRV